MSKLAHQRAYEQYPQGNDGSSARIGYTLGYDQAFQDFLEKAERWLEPTFKSIAGYNCGGDLINDFKNYMQNESEN